MVRVLSLKQYATVSIAMLGLLAVAFRDGQSERSAQPAAPIAAPQGAAPRTPGETRTSAEMSAGNSLDAGRRTRAEFITSLGAADTLALLHDLDELVRADDRAGWLLALLDHLTQLDPLLAAAFVADLPATPARDPLLDRVVATWRSNEGYEPVLRWARTLPDGAMKERTFVHLSHDWFSDDPGKALAAAARLHSATGQFLNTVLSLWAQQDPSSAAAWVTQAVNPPQRPRAIATLVAGWAATSPREAAGFVATLPPGEAKTGAITSVASAWAQRAPSDAAEWAATLGEESQRAIVLAHVIQAWGRRDAAAAAEWLARLAPGPVYDEACIVFTSAIADRYPAIAMTFAGAVSDPRLRAERLEFVTRRWLASDPVVATRALQRAAEPAAGSGLP